MNREEIHNHVITRKDHTDMGRIHTRLNELTPYVFEAGELLREVHERKLFLVHADSFKAYVEDVLGWTRSRAYQLMDADEVMKSLPDECQPLVDTERAARALIPVPAKQRAPVLKDASVNGAPPTAKAITEAAKRAKIPMPPEDDGVVDVEEIVLDETGFTIPAHRVAFFKRGQEGRDLLRGIAVIRGALRAAQEAKDPLFSFVNTSTTMANLDNAYGDIKMAIPFVVCPYCQGQTSDHCPTCRKTGFLPEHQWKHAVPSDLKAVREKSCKK